MKRWYVDLVLFFKKRYYNSCAFKVHKLENSSNDERTNFPPRKTKSRIINYTKQKNKEGKQGKNVRVERFTLINE